MMPNAPYYPVLSQVTHGSGPDHSEDESVEVRYEEIPSTLVHITELMLEKELRLPLQEQEVLMEP